MVISLHLYSLYYIIYVESRAIKWAMYIVLQHIYISPIPNLESNNRIKACLIDVSTGFHICKLHPLKISHPHRNQPGMRLKTLTLHVCRESLAVPFYQCVKQLTFIFAFIKKIFPYKEFILKQWSSIEGHIWLHFHILYNLLAYGHI